MVSLRLKRATLRSASKKSPDETLMVERHTTSAANDCDDVSFAYHNQDKALECPAEYVYERSSTLQLPAEIHKHIEKSDDKLTGHAKSVRKPRTKEIAFRRDKDFFKCPPLSQQTKSMLVRKANGTANLLIRDSIEPEPISSILWKYHSTVDGIQVYRGFDRGQGGMTSAPTYMEDSDQVNVEQQGIPSNDDKQDPSVAANDRERDITCIRGVTEVSATLEEFAMLFKMDSRKQCSDNSLLFNADLLDSEVLYPLVRPSGEHPRRLVAIKWSVLQSPSKIFRNRDFCYLECQKEFHDTKGRKGWVRSFHSVRMSCCPSLEKDYGIVRGSLYRCGLIAIESATKPGVLDTTYTVEVDLKGHIPDKLIRSFLCHRIAAIGSVDKLLQRQRLSTSPLLGDLDIPVTKAKSACHLCYRLFSRVFGAKRFTCRRCGEAACANCCDFWILDIPVIGTKRVCICTYCAAEARTNHSVPISSRGRARVLYTPRHLAAYESAMGADKYSEDAGRESREAYHDSYLARQTMYSPYPVKEDSERIGNDRSASKPPLSENKNFISPALAHEAYLHKHFSENALERLKPDLLMQQHAYASENRQGIVTNRKLRHQRFVPERARSEQCINNIATQYIGSTRQSEDVRPMLLRTNPIDEGDCDLPTSKSHTEHVPELVNSIHTDSSIKQKSIGTCSSSNTHRSSDYCVTDAFPINHSSKTITQSEVFEFIEGKNGEWVAKQNQKSAVKGATNDCTNFAGKRLSHLLRQETTVIAVEDAPDEQCSLLNDAESISGSSLEADDCPGCGTTIQKTLLNGALVDTCFCLRSRPPVLCFEDMEDSLESKPHPYAASSSAQATCTAPAMLEEGTFEI